MHVNWDKVCLKFIQRSKLYDKKHLENNMVYFSTKEDWMLTTRPNKISMEKCFPQCFVVNSLPIINKRTTNKGKKAAIVLDSQN